MLINRREKVGIKTLKNPRAFIDYSQTIDDVYENLEDYNPTKKTRALIVFVDMIVDMESNKKLNAIFTELFLREKKNQYFTYFYVCFLLLLLLLFACLFVFLLVVVCFVLFFLFIFSLGMG